MPVLDFPFTWVRQDASATVAVLQGMWLQAGGYWWADYSSLTPMLPLAMSRQTVGHTETFSGSDIHDGGGFIYAYSTILPSGFYFDFTATLVKMDGVTISLAPGHLVVNTDGGVTIRFSPIPDPSTYGSIPALLEIAYTYKLVDTKVVIASAGAGPATAISPRGNIMFPTATDDQMLAVLQADYEALDGEPVLTPIEETQISGSGDFSFTLSHTPSDEVSADFYGLDAMGISYLVYSVARTFYGLIGSSASMNGDIAITYSYVSGDLNSTSEPFSADGGNRVVVAHSIDSLNSVTIDGAQDLLATFFGRTVTLSVVPTVGAAIVVDYNYYDSTEVTDVFPPPDFPPQYTFTLSQTPLVGTISVPVAPDPNMSGGFSTTGLDTLPLIDGAEVRFALQIPDNTFGFFNYSYIIISGSLFNITGMRVEERNLSESGSASLPVPLSAPFSATPVTPFLAALSHVGAAGGTHWLDGWRQQHWGFLHYDPLSQGYTVVGPDGLYWRSRTPGVTPGTHYTRMAWPAETPSTDATFAGWSWTQSQFYPAGTNPGAAPGVARRTAPYMGVSVVSRYALQGSWGAVGPNITKNDPGGSGCPSDSTFPIRFFRRDDNKLWQPVAELTPFDLVQGNAGVNPLYIPGTGIIHQEGSNNLGPGIWGDNGNFAIGRRRFGSVQSNSWWPATRNATSWVMGCGWCEGEWLRNVAALNTQQDFTNFPMGVTDSGYTLSAVDMAGAVTSQLTIKCDPNYEEAAWLDADAAVQYDIAHANDQFSYNPYGQPGTNGFGPIHETWAATDRWGYLDGYGYCFFFYAMTSVDGPAKKPKLQVPGIPALADGEPRYSFGSSLFPSTSSQYGIIAGEDTPASQNIVGDGDDNFYFTLSIPYWLRIIDGTPPNRTEVIIGTHTETIAQGGTNRYFVYNISGYLDVPIISQAGPQGTYSGNVVNTFPQGGFISIYMQTFNKQVCFANPDIAVFNPEPPPGHYTYTYNGTVTMPWRHVIPNRASCILRGTYNFGDPANYFWGNPIIGGGPIAPQPWQGAAIYDVAGDNRRNYTVEARSFLFKVNCVNGTLSEVWRKDVSQVYDYFTAQYRLFPGTKQAVSAFNKVFHTRPCGRFILLLRKRYERLDDLENQPIPLLVLEAWTNAAPPVLVHRTYLPDKPDPLLYATVSPAAFADDLQMHDGVDSDGREWALVVWASGPRGEVHGRFKVQYDAVQSNPPVVTDDSVTAYTTGATLAPTIHNAQGMAEAVDIYAWTDDDGAVYRRNGE